jgi:hypothetical protein
MSAPAGHFGARLQTLLHSGDANGSFSLTNTANQQSQIGAMIGGQLTSAAGFGSGASATHRPASLLGQTLADGSNKNLGLRTNQSSTGPFGLVGSQSIGDLMTSHTPSGSGLMNGADAIANAIPEGGSPPLPAALGHAIQSPAPTAAGPVPGFVVLSPPSNVPPGSAPKGKGGPARKDPGQLPDATFRLAVSPASGGSFVETGTFSIPSDWSSSGMTWLNVHVYVWDTSDNNAGEGWWSEYAYPAAGTYGFDLAALGAFNSNLDAFNAQYFSDLVNNSDPSYALTVTATTPFSVSDTSTPTQQSGTVTTAFQNNYTTTGTDAFSVSFAGPAGADRVMVRDDTVNATFGGSDSGTDTDSGNPAVASVTNDSFGNSVTNGTTTEVDHTEGTIAADGTFQLTSFSVDSTSDEDFTDSVTGTTHAPEPGGSESDTFTDNDSGHDHEHLHAEGSPTSWTASFDDTANDNYADVDNGGENSSQTTTGATTATDTNSDTFHADDGGTHTDVFHLAGSGDATTFTANSVNDRIEDISDFHDWDDGNSGDNSATGTESDTDTDHYHNTDNGHADEVLTITGDANSLTAGYTDGVHDGFTDSEDIHDGWADPAVHDSGLDHSTDGDNGSEDVTLSAGASLANWQSDSTTEPAPTWEITNICASCHNGTANVNADDDGTDNVVPNSHDGQSEHFVDHSTGTDSFGFDLDGTTPALTTYSTIALHTHSADDNTGHWDDPTQLDGHSASDGGSEEIDNTDDYDAVVMVSNTESLAADGTTAVTEGHVDVTDTGTVGLTDDGSETINGESGGPLVIDSSQGTANGPSLLPGQDNQSDGFHETLRLNVEEDHVHIDTSGGTATIHDDDVMDGTVSLTGTENDTDTLRPDDETTVAAGGNLGGAVNDNLHLSALLAGGLAHLTSSNGDLGDILTGSAHSTTTEYIDTAGGGGAYASLFPTQVAEFLIPAVVLPPVPADGAPPVEAEVTITETENVPSVHLTDDESDVDGTWTLDHLDCGETAVTGMAYDGHYTNCLLIAGGTGDESASWTDTAIMAETGSTADVQASETTTHVASLQADAAVNLPGVYTGSAQATLSKSIVDTVGGDLTAAGPNLTETRTGNGNSSLTYDLTLGADGSGTWQYSKVQTYQLAQADTDVGGTIAFTGFGGTDVSDQQKVTAGPGWSSMFIDHRTLTRELLPVDQPGAVLQDGNDPPAAPQPQIPVVSAGDLPQPINDGHGNPDNDLLNELTASSALKVGSPYPKISQAIDAANAAIDAQNRAFAELSRALFPFTSAPDINPDSIGGADGWSALIPFYGNGRNAVNDFQNGRYASSAFNTGMVALDFFAVKSIISLGKAGVTWASRKLAGEATAAQKMATVRRLGREGEAAANIVKNTARIPSLSGTAAYRIPEELTKTVLKEVKNVAKLSFTAQLRDSLHYAIETGRDFVLVVRAGDGTRLSPQLQAAIRAGWIILENLP